MTQEEALQILKTGKNVFLTGPAGSGKTYLLNTYIEYLKNNHVPVAITASTGIAATHMNGRTIHSWSGIKLNRTLSARDIDTLFYTTEIRMRIARPRVLIIDEISMLDADRLNLIDAVCKRLRENPFPFGGLQIVFSGDFFQLPPISQRDETPLEFAFQSVAWREANIHTCYLEKQHRQNDPLFLELLSAIRNNAASNEVKKGLMERYKKPIPKVKKPIKLSTHNIQVDSINEAELAEIKEKIHSYQMSHMGDADVVAELKKSCLAPEILNLKKGARVIFVKNNFEGGYVNGTIGTVVNFTKDDMPIVKKEDGTLVYASPTSWDIEEDEKILARITQIPLRLAWAITIHKSQGMSLDHAEVDLGRAFTEGMGYVALSRVRTFEGLTITGLNAMAFKVNNHITSFDSLLKEASEETKKLLYSMSPSEIEEAEEVFIKGE